MIIGTPLETKTAEKHSPISHIYTSQFIFNKTIKRVMFDAETS